MLTGKKATIKFYVGDTVEQHLQSLVRMFQLNSQQSYVVKQQLEREFGELTTEYLAKQVAKQDNAP